MTRKRKIRRSEAKSGLAVLFLLLFLSRFFLRIDMLLRLATLAVRGHLLLAARIRPLFLVHPRGLAAARARTAPRRAADFRSLLSPAAAASSSSPSPPPPPQPRPRQKKHRLVFLGTPEPAARVLRSLIEASKLPSSCFEVAAVVSQPPKAQGRGRRAAPPSPVAVAAVAAGFEEGGAAAAAAAVAAAPLSPPLSLPAAAPPLLLCPASPKDEDFLTLMERMEPDLCVTVAYGGLLSSRFLSIPKRGTLNVHPSLLPRWRGAAPVQRTLAAGDAECGVSLAFTVLALDAGPVLASEAMPTPPRATAPELLCLLMGKGGDLLLRELPRVLSGDAAFETATPQAEIERAALEEGFGGVGVGGVGGGGEGRAARFASHAARLTRGDGRLEPHTQTLRQAFDRWRSAAGWPGGWLVVKTAGEEEEEEEEEEKELRLEEAAPLLEEAEVELVRRAFASSSSSSFPPPPGSLAVTKDALLIACADGGILSVSQVKPAGRKAMSAGAWANGLGGKKVVAVKVKEEEEEE